MRHFVLAALLCSCECQPHYDTEIPLECRAEAGKFYLDCVGKETEDWRCLATMYTLFGIEVLPGVVEGTCSVPPPYIAECQQAWRKFEELRQRCEQFKL